MKSNSRFYAEHGPSAGMCKVVADAGTGAILGIHFVGGVSSGACGRRRPVVIEAELRVNELKDVILPDIRVLSRGGAGSRSWTDRINILKEECYSPGQY